ncbi:hypothetical protein ARMGADRAFT_1084231 [Armillaria gallica]|uniref:Uncharacterized protein n=1 Tax=Armillaria gallica TaxID=47427 RepID=A0A2H3DK84_ARMGA|nr:hypothetical protein ARMGADRAFT_1084231 [Armillaria gallica]
MASGVLPWRPDWPTCDKNPKAKDAAERIEGVAFLSTDHGCEHHPHANHQQSVKGASDVLTAKVASLASSVLRRASGGDTSTWMAVGFWVAQRTGHQDNFGRRPGGAWEEHRTTTLFITDNIKKREFFTYA